MLIVIMIKLKRYQYYIDYCFERLCSDLASITRNLESYQSRITKLIGDNAQSTKVSFPKIRIDELKSTEIVKVEGQYYHYYLSKLAEQKHLDFIDVLIDENINNAVLCCELNNMRLAYYEHNNCEYYISFAYVSKMIE